jgi:DNA-binding transcriptional ArsR family regulator
MYRYLRGGIMSRKQAGAGSAPDYRRAAAYIKQASDATRLRTLVTLLGGERNVTELCAEAAMSQPALSHHVALLRHGGLIEPRRQGKNNYYALTDRGRALATAVQSMVG